MIGIDKSGMTLSILDLAAPASCAFGGLDWIMLPLFAWSRTALGRLDR
jgi:hypothetical protein